MSNLIESTVTFDQLKSFLNPDHEILKNALLIANHRGDLTESGERRLRALIGDEAYKSVHFDTAICNGRVLFVIPRFKHPEAVEKPMGFHFPAEWFWCFAEIEEGSPEVIPARPETFDLIPDDLKVALSCIDGLEFLELKRLNYYRDNKRASKEPPEGVVFFRFPGGYGLSVARRK